MNTAEEVVKKDLGYIVRSLNSEFGKMAGKHVLITGGAGFLGYYLVRSLLNHNEYVPDHDAIRITVYDNYIRGVPDWLDSVRNDDHVILQEHDVTRPLPAHMADYQYIICAASIASPLYYRKYPLETMDANVNGLRHLLDYARRQKEKARPVDGFLFFSTSEIYGDPDKDHIPTPETYRGNVSSIGPRACYDESKRYGETLCVTFARQYGLPVTIARPFNNYGPGLKITDRRVIPDFMRDVLEGNNIIMYSDGNPSRTFCYIADAVIGYFKILAHGRPGEAYNIGVEDPEITMRELAETIVRVGSRQSAYNGRVIREQSTDSDYLVDNPSRRCPMIAKARKEIGYDPSIGLEEGLIRSFLWYKGNQEAIEA